MLFWYILSGINNEFAPGKACWALQESQGNRVVRESWRERGGEHTETLKSNKVRNTAEVKERTDHGCSGTVSSFAHP